MRKAIAACLPRWVKDLIMGRLYRSEVRRWYRQLRYDADGRARFQASRPVLTDCQRRVADELSKRGISMVHFDELVGDPGLWGDVQRSMATFEQSSRVQDAIALYREKYAAPESKSAYLVTQWRDDAAVPIDDVWMQLGLRPFLLDVVNTYLGMWSKLNYVNAWYTIPIDEDRQRAFSQNWHRDPEDRKLVKVFLYCNDIDESTGPFEYVPNTSLSGPHRRLFPLGYPPEGAIEARFSPEQRMTCTCPAGTFVFCDTTGFHRGGFAQHKARRLATWCYVRPSSWYPRRFVAALQAVPSSLSAAGKYALE